LKGGWEAWEDSSQCPLVRRYLPWLLSKIITLSRQLITLVLLYAPYERRSARIAPGISLEEVRYIGYDACRYADIAYVASHVGRQTSRAHTKATVGWPVRTSISPCLQDRLILEATHHSAEPQPALAESSLVQPDHVVTPIRLALPPNLSHSSTKPFVACRLAFKRRSGHSCMHQTILARGGFYR
jgi:hypothetical protein